MARTPRNLRWNLSTVIGQAWPFWLCGNDVQRVDKVGKSVLAEPNHHQAAERDKLWMRHVKASSVRQKKFEWPEAVAGELAQLFNPDRAQLPAARRTRQAQNERRHHRFENFSLFPY